jgi:hypothetical protein
MKRRDILYTIPAAALMFVAGCDDSAGQAALDVASTKITLGIMPDVFVQKFNDGISPVLEAITNNDAFMRRSITKLYMLYDHRVNMGNTHGMFKSESGPLKTPIFGTTALSGELTVLGTSLGDNTREARQDFLMIATVMGYALTADDPKKVRKTMVRLVNTIVDNPEDVVSEAIGDVLFSATLSKTGIAIQAEHKQ